jgi:hypothetical protein
MTEFSSPLSVPFIISAAVITVDGLSSVYAVNFTCTSTMFSVSALDTLVGLDVIIFCVVGWGVAFVGLVFGFNV